MLGTSSEIMTSSVLFLRNTIVGAELPYLSLNFLGFLEIFRVVFIPMTSVSEIVVLFLRPYF